MTTKAIDLDEYTRKIAARRVAGLIPDRLQIVEGAEVYYSIDRPEEGPPELRGAHVAAVIWVDGRERLEARSMLGRKGPDVPSVQALTSEQLTVAHAATGDPGLPSTPHLFEPAELATIAAALRAYGQPDEEVYIEPLIRRIENGYFGAKPDHDPGRVHAQAGPDQGLGAEGAEDEPRKTASDAVAAVNRGRVGSLAIPHSREYLEALRRQVQDWLATIEEELGTSSVDRATDAYDILEWQALSAVPGSVHNGEYSCPSGRGKIDLNGMARELSESGSADVRTHRTGRPRARELDRVLAAWRSAGLEIYA